MSIKTTKRYTYLKYFRDRLGMTQQEMVKDINEKFNENLYQANYHLLERGGSQGSQKYRALVYQYLVMYHPDVVPDYVTENTLTQELNL